MLLPPFPNLFVGREQDTASIIRQLVHSGPTDERLQSVTALHGWPGVGKTTLTTAVAHTDAIHVAFPDGVLWCSLGQEHSTRTMSP